MKEKTELKEEIVIRGFLECWVEKANGLIVPVYKGPNEIRSSLKTYLRDKMDNPTLDNAIDNLFTDDEIQAGGTQNGLDGILCVDGTTGLTTITTAVTPSNASARKWQGNITFSASGSINQAELGFSLSGTGGADFQFTTPYARQTFASVAVVASDKMTFNWELYI